MTEQVTETQAPELSVRDLALCVNIIDLCSKRGAFEGAELAEVGGVRGRIAAFVRASQPAPEEADEAVEEVTEGESGE